MLLTVCETCFPFLYVPLSHSVGCVCVLQELMCDQRVCGLALQQAGRAQEGLLVPEMQGPTL